MKEKQRLICPNCGWVTKRAMKFYETGVVADEFCSHCGYLLVAREEIQPEPNFFEQLYKEHEGTPSYEAAGLRIEVAEILHGAMTTGPKKVRKADLAKRLGTNRSWVTRILQGKENLTLDTLARLGCALGFRWNFNGPFEAALRREGEK